MNPLNEFDDYLTGRRAELLASPRSGSREAAAPASESPVGHGLGVLLEATGAAGGAIRQSIGFTHPGSTPGAASAAGDDVVADVAPLVATLSAFMTPAASQQLKGLLEALEQATRMRNAVLVGVLRDRIAAIIAAETATPQLTSGAVASPGLGASSRGSAAFSAADQDLQQAFDLHVTNSDVFATGGGPKFTMSSKIADIFGFIDGLVGQLSLVRPYGSTLAMCIAICMQVDQVPHVCAKAVLSPGDDSPYDQAHDLLQQALTAEAKRNPYGVRRAVGNEYAASVDMLRRAYGYLLSPANENALPDSVFILRRLDQLLMNLLFRHLDCPWRKEASVAGAANVVDLLSKMLVRLGDDDQAMCDRQLDQLDAPTKIPVGPCSDPLAQYIKMLQAVWEHQLEMHRKLQVNTATRFLLRLMGRPPVATGRALQEALAHFHRETKRQVRTSDHSPEAIRDLLEKAAARLEHASFDGILLPHGSKKPADGGGAAYWGQSGGDSVEHRKCHRCGKVGHLRPQCPDSQPTCNRCGKVGHIRPQCPDRQQRQSGAGVAPSAQDSERGRSTSQPPPTTRNPRTPSPHWREPCAMGFDCPHKGDAKKCPKYHPSKPKKEKESAATAPPVPEVAAASGGQGKGGKEGKGGKGGKGGKKDGSVANDWFSGLVEVVSSGMALLSVDGLDRAPAKLAESAAAAQPAAQREIRWGADQVKEVAVIPVGELAPSVGELPPDLYSASRAAASAPVAMRQLPPRQYGPHPEVRSQLLSKSRTEKLYRTYLQRSATRAWCALTGDQKRFQIVALGCNWVEHLNRFLASCLHHGLPIHSYMLDEWERLIRPPRQVALRGWRSCSSKSAVAQPPALPPVAPPSVAPAVPMPPVMPPVEPVADPAAVGVAHVDIRSVEEAAVADGQDVYFVQNCLDNVLDSGCSLRAMTGAGSEGLVEVRDLAPHECLEVTGIGGKVRIRQSGKKAHRIAVKLYHSDLQLQRLLADLHVEFQATLAASGQSADPLYYYFVLEYLINPGMRPGLSLIGCGAMVLDLGWRITLDSKPGASHALSRADDLTQVRLEVALGFGNKNGRGGRNDCLLHIRGLELVPAGVDVRENANRTWEYVRVLHREAQERIAAEQRARLAEISEGPYSLYGYVGLVMEDAPIARKWPNPYSALCDDDDEDASVSGVDADGGALCAAGAQEAEAGCAAPEDDDWGEFVAYDARLVTSCFCPVVHGVELPRAAVEDDDAWGAFVAYDASLEDSYFSAALDEIESQEAVPMVMVAESSPVAVSSGAGPSGARPYYRPYSEDPLLSLPDKKMRKALLGRIAKIQNPVVVDCCAGTRPFARGLLRVCGNVRVLSIDVVALEPLSDLTDDEHARHTEVVMDARLLTMESLGQLVFERFGLGRESVVFFGAFPPCTHITTASHFGAVHPHRLPTLEPRTPEAVESDALRLHLLQLCHDLWVQCGIPSALEQPASEVLFGVPSHLAWLAAHPDVTVNYFDQCSVSMPGEVLPKKPTVVFGMGLRPFNLRCDNACSSRLPGTDLHRLVIAPRSSSWQSRGQQRVSSEAAATLPLGAVITLLYVARLKPRPLPDPNVCVAAISGFPAHNELQYDSALLHASSGHTSDKVLRRTLADVVPFAIRTNGGAVKLSSEVSRADIRLPKPCSTCILAKAVHSASHHTNNAKSFKRLSAAERQRFHHKISTSVRDRHLYVAETAVP